FEERPATDFTDAGGDNMPRIRRLTVRLQHKPKELVRLPKTPVGLSGRSLTNPENQDTIPPFGTAKIIKVAEFPVVFTFTS
ncbi:hypothetical protein CH330_08740, partial [candidate division WOR-3 bacterium JGI_Cruoil_03_51_56]